METITTPVQYPTDWVNAFHANLANKKGFVGSDLLLITSATAPSLAKDSATIETRGITRNYNSQFQKATTNSGTFRGEDELNNNTEGLPAAGGNAGVHEN